MAQRVVNGRDGRARWTRSAPHGVSSEGSGSGGGNGGTVHGRSDDSASVATVATMPMRSWRSRCGGGGQWRRRQCQSKQIGSGFNLTAKSGSADQQRRRRRRERDCDPRQRHQLQTSGSGSRACCPVDRRWRRDFQAQRAGWASASLPGGEEAEESEEGRAFLRILSTFRWPHRRSGGSAGTVDVTTAGKITTSGADADGVWRSRIGGGGGLGGSVGQATSDGSEPLDDEGESDCSSVDGDGESGYCSESVSARTIDDGGTGGTAQPATRSR